MYKKILVPLDGSEMAECSLEHLKEVALGCHVPEVVLLTVIEPIEAATYAFNLAAAGYHYSPEEGTEIKKEMDKTFEKSVAAAGAYLEKVAKKLIEEGMNVKTEIVKGNPAETILDYASNTGVDLVIISAHGWGGKTRWDFGRVTDRVIRSLNIPVVVASPKGCRV
jgi:nucleotide-binding universal stress UspA family protein